MHVGAGAVAHASLGQTRFDYPVSHMVPKGRSNFWAHSQSITGSGQKGKTKKKDACQNLIFWLTTDIDI